MSPTKEQALIFDVSRYRIEDGPGIRTAVFFKGCPLRCKWCSNPFGLKKKPELAYNNNKCTGCLTCVQVCPQQAIKVKGKRPAYNRKLCNTCGLCVSACPTKALAITGEYYSVVDLLRQVQRDQMFYRRNNGGVTLTGGEVLLQSEAAAELLQQCRSEMIHSAVETSGYGKWESLERLLALSDIVFMDIKHFNSKVHRELTGVPNEIILDNIKNAIRYSLKIGSPQIIIRIPIIPGLNDSEENLIQTGSFLYSLNNKLEINLLPYHMLGSDKYEMIGLRYELKDCEILVKQRMEEYRRLISTTGVSCSVGGSEIDTVG